MGSLDYDIEGKFSEIPQGAKLNLARGTNTPS